MSKQPLKLSSAIVRVTTHGSGDLRAKGPSIARSCVILTIMTFMMVVASGCQTAPVGGTCSRDADCDFGLQCFDPGTELTPVCTIGCSPEEPCADGACITTSLGDVCAPDCPLNGQCEGELSCQISASNDQVCWYPDETLQPAVPEDVVGVGSATIVDDTNGDGVLNPGETGRILLYAENRGAEDHDGLWMRLYNQPADLTVLSCKQDAYPAPVQCTAACSCEHVTPGARWSLPANSFSSGVVLDIAFTLAPTATGALVLQVETGKASNPEVRWLDAVSIPIEPLVGAISIAVVAVVVDENADGFLTPGERGVLDIHLVNTGTSHIEGIWAELSVIDPKVTVLDCETSVGGAWWPCDAKCNCQSAVATAKQSLQPGETGAHPVLRMTFEVAGDAELGQAAFGVRFHDALGHLWYDSFSIDILASEVTLGLSRWEVFEDANSDGFVSPAETASIQIFAKNSGTSRAVDIWASLVSSDPLLTVDSCRVGVGAGWTDCDALCSCQGALASARQALGPGEEGSVAVLVVTFTVSPTAPTSSLDFTVAFHDATGASWTSTIDLPLTAPDSVVEIGNAVLLDDNNADGFLSPSESATLEVYPRNTGTSRAIGLWAEVTYVDPVADVTSCYTSSSEGVQACDSGCSCGSLTGSFQDLDPGQSSSQALIQINFTLSADAPLQPLLFEVTFHDALGNTWTDTHQIDVVEVQAMVAVASADLWGDSNGDGVLTPGESAKVQIKARNTGISSTVGVYAELTGVDDSVTVATCYAQTGDTWAKCDAACNCSGITQSAKQTLNSGETGEEVILRINFSLALDAPVEPLTWTVTFRDEFGNAWTDTFIIDVESYAADVKVGFTQFENDTNADGFLSPAESATLLVYAENKGTLTAQDVWAKLVAVEPGVTVTNCYTQSAGSWVNCNAACSCVDVFDDALQTLDPGVTASVPILRIEFTVSPQVEPGTLSFGVAFTDSMGITSTDAIVLDVVNPDTTLQVGLAELVSETNGDSILSPGESATVNIFAENLGSTDAQGVFAKLTSPNPNIVVTSCFTINESDYTSCDLTCSCQQIPSELKSIIAAGEISNDVILSINFDLLAGAPLQPLPFIVEFTDQLQNTWLDTFSLDVASP